VPASSLCCSAVYDADNCLAHRQHQSARGTSTARFRARHGQAHTDPAARRPRSVLAPPLFDHGTNRQEAPARATALVGCLRPSTVCSVTGGLQQAPATMRSRMTRLLPGTPHLDVRERCRPPGGGPSASPNAVIIGNGPLVGPSGAPATTVNSGHPVPVAGVPMRRLSHGQTMDPRSR
jgi:hypothetical protein